MKIRTTVTIMFLNVLVVLQGLSVKHTLWSAGIIIIIIIIMTCNSSSSSLDVWRRIS